jgi:exonuclease VII large subunit
VAKRKELMAAFVAQQGARPPTEAAIALLRDRVDWLTSQHDDAQKRADHALRRLNEAQAKLDKGEKLRVAWVTVASIK